MFTRGQRKAGIYALRPVQSDASPAADEKETEPISVEPSSIIVIHPGTTLIRFLAALTRVCAQGRLTCALAERPTPVRNQFLT